MTTAQKNNTAKILANLQHEKQVAYEAQNWDMWEKIDLMIYYVKTYGQTTRPNFGDVDPHGDLYIQAQY
jgi:hypothetical protein